MSNTERHLRRFENAGLRSRLRVEKTKTQRMFPAITNNNFILQLTISHKKQGLFTPPTLEIPLFTASNSKVRIIRLWERDWSMKKAIINCLSSLIWFNKFSWIWFAQFSSWGCCLLTTPNNVWTLMLNGLPVLQIGCNAIFCVCDLRCQGQRWQGEWLPLSRHWTSSPRCPSQPSTPPHTPPPRSCSWLLWSEIIPNYQLNVFR